VFKEDSDEMLMLRYQRGDAEAFRSLAIRHRIGVMSFAFRYVSDSQVAEDVFQDTFLRLIRQAKRYKPQAKFTTLLYTIARNLCIDHLRKMEHRKHQSLSAGTDQNDEDSDTLENIIPGENPDADKSLFRKDLQKVLRKAIEALPDEQREVFILREYEDLRFREIAKVTRTTTNTVKSRMRYALANLRKSLAKARITEEVVRDEVL
jgi:RNA polymerase sigma-70 factor (ECF subfamily)